MPSGPDRYANRRLHRAEFLCVLAAFGLLCLAVRQAAGAAEPPITALAIAPDGNSIVAVSQLGLQILTWPDLDRRTTIKTAAANLHCVAFSPSGKRVAVGGGNPSREGMVEIFGWPPRGRSPHAPSADRLASILYLQQPAVFGQQPSCPLRNSSDARQHASTR